jgi:hypothetical protein
VWDLSSQKRDAVAETRRETNVPKSAVGQLTFTQGSDHYVEPKHEFKEVNEPRQIKIIDKISQVKLGADIGTSVRGSALRN